LDEWILNSTHPYTQKQMEMICEAHAPRPDRFTPGEGASLIHRIKSWFDGKGGLDAVEKKIVSSVFCP
jgi:hypothetical protein